MNATDIIKPHYQDGQFTDWFIQMFVEVDNRFNYAFFNKYFEVKLSHRDINFAVETLSGSKVIKYREPEDEDILEAMYSEYKFGKYENARMWVNHIWENFGSIISRPKMLAWIATQRPDKAVGSFLPTHDGNLYAKDEYVSRADSGTGAAGVEPDA